MKRSLFYSIVCALGLALFSSCSVHHSIRLVKVETTHEFLDQLAEVVRYFGSKG